ncbi:MAG: FecR domain-containing protein [Geothrix sp.]|nr:FecR domain-containing protein [Geothrix sp.]
MNPTFTHARLAVLLLPAVLLMAGPQVPPPPARIPPPPPSQLPDPDQDEEDTYQGEAPDRYAMVRIVEGEVHIRKGELDELLSRGTPIAEGDVVESRGRGVLQLGDGTRVVFGGATRFTVAALFTDLKGEKQVLLRLDYGRLRVLLGGQSDARFRVDTPSGSTTCYDMGAFTLEVDRDQVVRLKVLSGRVAFANARTEGRINAGERLTVYSAQDSLDRVRDFNTYDGDDFDRWSDRAVVIPRGESWDRVPPELRYYADELDGHGRWIESDEFGWVWQPAGVAEDWRPYADGRWAPYPGGMTWVSDEPWAYVAYHHGRWHWGAGLGWCWIPGVNYSPAWVAWNNTPGYCGWAPLGYYNTPCTWGYGAWRGGYAWNVVSINFINAPNVRTRIYSDAHVLGAFNGPGGGRDLRAPWRRSPLMVSNGEFRNPVQVQTAFRRDVGRERLVAYERQAQAATGRTILRHDMTPPPSRGPRPLGDGGPARVPFEDRRRTISTEHPIAPRDRPVDPRSRIEDRRPDPAPARPVDPRSRIEDRRPDPAPARPVDPRSRFEDRRPDPAPARPVDPRSRMEDRRPDPAPARPADSRPRIDERRPDPPKAPEREARPVQRPEPAREKPHEEKKRD